MRFSAGVILGGIVSMLIWGAFTLGWGPGWAVAGIILAIFVLMYIIGEFTKHWD